MAPAKTFQHGLTFVTAVTLQTENPVHFSLLAIDLQQRYESDMKTCSIKHKENI